MRVLIALVIAVALVLFAAPACDADSARTCNAAWIGHPQIALGTTPKTFEVSPSGALRELAKAPIVYSGAHPFSGWYRAKRAPHGGWTALVRGKRRTDLFLERGGRRMLVDRDVLIGSVVWSPNGKALAFAVHGAARGRLANAATGYRVRPIRATVCSPFAWSRDSKRVAFVASRTGNCQPAPSTLDVVDPASGAIVSSSELSAGVWSGPPTWSADDAYVPHSHALTPGIAVASRSGYPTYSADGCTSARWAPIGHELATACHGSLTLINAATGRQRTYPTQVPHPRDAPFWAPDARALATMSDTAFSVTPLAGKAVTIPFSRCIAAGILGFDRTSGRAVISASIAPPAD